MAFVGAVMLIDVIMLVVWHLMDPLVVQLYQIDREVIAGHLTERERYGEREGDIARGRESEHTK